MMDLGDILRVTLATAITVMTVKVFAGIGFYLWRALE
jgi:hypothetical protein